MVTLKYISNNWFSSTGVSHVAMLAKTRVCHTVYQFVVVLDGINILLPVYCVTNINGIWYSTVF